MLAPNIFKRGSINISPIIVIEIIIIQSKVKAFPNIFSASSFLCCPNLIDIIEAEPIPINILKAINTVIIGNVKPTPVIAKDPTSFICPIYILSIILYKALTIIPIMAGAENFNNNFFTLSSPNCFCLSILFLQSII